MDNNVGAAFAMNARSLIQLVYTAAHSYDAGREVVFTGQAGDPFTLTQVGTCVCPGRTGGPAPSPD